VASVVETLANTFFIVHAINIHDEYYDNFQDSLIPQHQAF
jgi:hypothetical protein